MLKCEAWMRSASTFADQVHADVHVNVHVNVNVHGEQVQSGVGVGP